MLIFIGVGFVVALSLVYSSSAIAKSEANNTSHSASCLATNPLTWTVEIVDRTDDIYKLTSLDLDSIGRPRIAYLNSFVFSPTVIYGNLMYARYDDPGWITQTLVSVGAYDYPLSGIALALDDSDNAHISYHYFDPSYWPYVGGHLKHIHQAEAIWYDQVIDLGKQKIAVGGWPSNAVDHYGYVHIGYARRDFITDTNDAVLYAYYTGTNWITETVANVSSQNVSFAVNSVGKPYVSYYNQNLRALQYAWRTGNIWYTETITALLSSNFSNSVFWLDENDHPFIAFTVDQPPGNRHLIYGWRDSIGWNFETVYSGEVWNIDLTVRLGVPYIGFSKLGPSVLKFAYKDKDGWHFETVDTSGGESLSLAIDSFMRPLFSYLGDDKTLRHTYRPCPLDKCSLHEVYLPSIQR